jgi:hypothetical protein
VYVTAQITIDITSTGANGRDGDDAEGADQWWGAFVIWQPDGTTAGLLSLNESSSPTLPAGYTKSRFVGWMRNDASSNFLWFTMVGSGRDRWVHFTSQNALNGSSLTWASVDCSAIVPPTASICSGVFKKGGTTIGYWRPGDSTVVTPGGVQQVNGTSSGGSTTGQGALIRLDPSDQTFDYKLSGAGGNFFADINGYWLNL